MATTIAEAVAQQASANKSNNSTTRMDDPVPSIRLAITKEDVDRVLAASDALHEKLTIISSVSLPARASSSSSPASKQQGDPKEKEEQTAAKKDTEPVDENKQQEEDKESSKQNHCETAESQEEENTSTSRPMHEMIYEAAQACEHPMVVTFLEKMKAAGASPQEIQAGILLFYKMDKASKTKLLFQVLGREESSEGGEDVDKEGKPSSSSSESLVPTSPCLSKEEAVSLFRTVVTAISSCIHKNVSSVQIEMAAEAEQEERPRKRAKLDGAHHSPKSGQSLSEDTIPSLKTAQTESFDMSMAPFHADEEVRKELEEIATFATEHLAKFLEKAGDSDGDGEETTKKFSVSYGQLDNWYSQDGKDIVPWMELLDLSNWKHPKVSPPTAKPLKLPDQLEDDGFEEEKKTDSPISKMPPPQDRVVPDATAKDSSSASESADKSKTIVSFDFTGSIPDAKDDEEAFSINITEENLSTLQRLVRTTGLQERHTADICNVLLQAARTETVDGSEVKTMPIERFHICLNDLMGKASSKKLSKQDDEICSSCFVDFFSCFDRKNGPLTSGEANAKELAVGLSFLCYGNKSSKLSSGYDVFENVVGQGLSADELTQFLRSYLTMLVGISLLTSSPGSIMKPKVPTVRRDSMFASIDHGARWTVNHFLKSLEMPEKEMSAMKFPFETFAAWYTNGGYHVAPWLELLDLGKLLGLIGANETAVPTGARTPVPPMNGLSDFPINQLTPKYHSPKRSRIAPGYPDPFAPTPPAAMMPAPAKVLFTFPLASQRSLVVLKEDASYVKGVVEQLGLLTKTPDEIWKCLYATALEKPPLAYQGVKAPPKSSLTKSLLSNKAMFVECMQKTITDLGSSKKRGSDGISKVAADAQGVLENFFHSFDLHQVDRVALNELMGGLTLLCGGKKSTKLAFAFGVFDQRNQQAKKKSKKQDTNSLWGEDLFLFLRSFLIVMFSCCRQSLDLSDDQVGRYIADTANSVTDNVMRYQWRTRKRDRVDFDEFGEWYNEGGYETAPWLELLDLKKWVLNETSQAKQERPRTPKSPGLHASLPLTPGTPRGQDYDCPPPPPDDSLDPSFFVDGDNPIMPMDSIDEMDILLLQQSQDQDEAAHMFSRSFSYTNSPRSTYTLSPRQKAPVRKARKTSKQPAASNPLKFNLITTDDLSGFMLSVSQKRIRHLRKILVASGLPKLDCAKACKAILGKKARNSPNISKGDFDAAMREIIAGASMSVEMQRSLSDVLGFIFSAFDRKGTGKVSALEIACGFTVLCKGKKSDKLEYAFEVLDKKGKLTKADTSKYLRAFLTVLLSVVSVPSLDSEKGDDIMTRTDGSKCDNSAKAQARAVEKGAAWAAAQAFKKRKSGKGLLTFDEFASWYTHVGYSNIPWLELLDLQKWVVTDKK